MELMGPVWCFLHCLHHCFLLLHQTESEDRIRQFFVNVQEYYTNVCALRRYNSQCIMNPFYSHLSPIANGEFEARIRALATKL